MIRESAIAVATLPVLDQAPREKKLHNLCGFKKDPK